MQCFGCGRFFKYDYSPNDKDCLCPICKDNSTPKSYAADHEWTQGHVTGGIMPDPSD